MSIDLLSNSNRSIFSNFQQALNNQNSETATEVGADPDSSLPNPASWRRYNFKKTYLFYSWQIPDSTELHGTARPEELFFRQPANTTIPE